jgi:hypothetical protein
VAYWLRPAVELGDDDDAVYSLRTILDARETVFGRGLDCSWALMGCCGGLLLPGLVSFPLFFFFSNSVFIFSGFYLVFEFIFEFCFILQVLKYLSIKII